MKVSVGRPKSAYERICVYGAPKVGKSRLSTSLPWGDYWGEKALYIAADNNAETLKSVLTHNQDRLVVVQPDGLGLQPADWAEEAFQIAFRNWKKEHPDVGTLIWDTMTETMVKILRQYADTGVFSDKHNVQIGSHQTGSWRTSPMEGDYGAAQDTAGRLLEKLVSTPMHLIIVFHEDWMEPKAGDIGGLIGGPATVGRKAIRWVPGKFDTVIYLQRLMMQNNQSKVVANTIQHGIWPAGVRHGDIDFKLAPQVPLDVDPVGFWREIVRQS